MNKVLSATVLCLGVLLLGAPSTAFAMDPSTAKIPFPFIVGDTVLPAGDYRVSEASGMTNVVHIISTDGRVGAFAMVEAVSPLDPAVPSASEFTFKKVGGEHYLASVTVAGEESVEFVLPRHLIADQTTKPSSPDERRPQ
ncbi:MAG: hypothetical protein NTV05_01950 [Acidobacteria bacterium]|nr:hypothetical protein [Acidobacteriota bacterium]